MIEYKSSLGSCCSGDMSVKQKHVDENYACDTIRLHKKTMYADKRNFWRSCR